MKRILVIGATSAIAAETARLYAQEKAHLFLAGRDPEKLQRLANDLTVRGASVVHTQTFDAHDLRSQETMLEDALAKLQEIDAVLIAHGSLPNQADCQANWPATHDALMVNLISPLCLLTWLGNYFERRGTGNITVISSVAGDRGRQSNYVYGASKGGLSHFLEGLRNRLAPRGVTVTTVKPGFVDTPMTAQLPKTKMFASAASVGARVHKAMNRGEDIVYTPGVWWPIMFAIRHVPESIFKKLKL